MGVFITFEGIEGCGKSTQIKQLHDYLTEHNYKTMLTREPGGTDISEAIRKILLNPDFSSMAPITELLLYNASRHQHIAECIQPALADNIIVLCDRYADATSAYQGAAREIDAHIINSLHNIATHNLMPHMTFLLDCPAEVGLQRVSKRIQSNTYITIDRLESEKIEFHQRVRHGYLTIAKNEPNRFRVIDALDSIDNIHTQIIDYVHHIL